LSAAFIRVVGGVSSKARAQRHVADLALRQARVAQEPVRALQPLMQNMLREGLAGLLEHAVQISDRQAERLGQARRIGRLPGYGIEN
jgi:hypothetical protein